MASKNFRVQKRKVLIDGVEYGGLVKTSGVKDTEGTSEIAGFQRTYTVKNGVKKFEPITLTYNLTAGSKIEKFLNDWKNKNEYHDVAMIKTDATGSEVSRYLLRDCECFSVEEEDYDAGSTKPMVIIAQITCTTDPDRIDA